MSLSEYLRKRDFKRTREPGVKKGKTPAHGQRSLFVVQKHAASHLHYDFRLEMGGVLKSWAVPKGFPYAQGEKRLAMEVEDHPLDYANFEGTIPKGQYGGGTVMVWDTGKYASLGGDAAKDLKAGKLHFELRGKKLKGEWTIVRLRHGEQENQWLLMKTGGDMKAISKKRDDESATSGRTMQKIATDDDAQWVSNREEKTARSKRPQKKSKPAKRGPDLKFVEPMKAKFVASPPGAGSWIYELKFDGYRALALKNRESVQMLSRNKKEIAERFPDVRDAVAGLGGGRMILDGEIVALDEKGRPSFQLLQALEMGTERPPLVYYVFDLINEEGQDLRALPLGERRARLQKILDKNKEGLVRFSGEIHGDPGKMLEETRKLGMEGIIGKRKDSEDEAGRRSGAWIKLKSVCEQEFVIGGWTRPKGTRSHFGALLIGFFAKDGLHFCGKVGTGFDHGLLGGVLKKMKALQQEKTPFINLPEKTAGRWGGGITPAEMKWCKWAKPELVCQVKFAEWTRDDKLRQPVFLGLRDDKAARKVVRERAA